MSHFGSSPQIGGQARAVVIGRRSPFLQGFVLLFAAILLLALLPLVLIGVLLALALGGRAALVRKWRSLRSPNGLLDGRRNVRVRVPGADDPRA